MNYRNLRAEKIIQTIETLHRRISERFPKRGLAKLCGELAEVATRLSKRANRISRPYVAVRFGSALLVIAGVFAQIWLQFSVFTQINFPQIGAVDGPPGTNALSLVTNVEAAVNLLILFGAGVLFLTTLEERIKRATILADLHELRTLIHVVDMHQLTKDPTRLLDRVRATPSSPYPTMTKYELTRYLDYCSEMLSLIGKIAALYGQNMRDRVVIDTINDLETLTTNLARKIWQKIMIVEGLSEQDAADLTPPVQDQAGQAPQPADATEGSS